MSEIDAEREARIREFAGAVIEKLKRPRNVAKSDWRLMYSDELVDLLRGEMDELERELEHASGDPDRPSQYFLEECLDVAAFAFMLWDMITWRAPRSARR